MCSLQMPRLLSDGMILQRNTKVKIWGKGVSGRNIQVELAHINSREDDKITKTVVTVEHTTVDSKGNFEVWIHTPEYGENYELTIEDSVGDKVTIKDVAIGDVFVCSGQSNMELPMERTKDQYPEEIRNCNYPLLRQFKIIENANFHGPIDELLSGSWQAANKESIYQFSATAYFFGRALVRDNHIPIGLINATLGGSKIQSWMGLDMLEGVDEDIALAQQYAKDEFIQGQIEKNIQQANSWHQELDQKDEGLGTVTWYEEDYPIDNWDTIELPNVFANTSLNGLIGSVWLSRNFNVLDEMTEVDTNLWLGTIVDSDVVCVNGTCVGRTEYQYPPRKYVIPAGLLHRGENRITIRVKCENGTGRVTPGKPYCIFIGEDIITKEKIDLTGTWRYRIGARAEVIPPTDFVNWKPTGLYNGMMAPCHNYVIKAVLWYQGESNTEAPEQYEKLSQRMIEGYRKKWNNPDLPFYYVQLPNFSIDLDKEHSGWPELREAQERLLQYPNTGMACVIDLGEDNDLHPLNKKDVGERLARLVQAKLYDMDIEYSGPVVTDVKVETKEDSYSLMLTCNHAEGGMYTQDASNIIDFEVASEDMNFVKAEAILHKDRIELSVKLDNTPVYVRYVHSNTPCGSLIYNKQGLPMAPFARKLM